MDVGFRSVEYKNGLFENTLRAEATKYMRLTSERLKLRFQIPVIADSKIYKEISEELLSIGGEIRRGVSDICVVVK